MEFKLQDVLNNQEKFQERFGYDNNSTLEEKVSFIHTHSSFAVEEIYEMLRELPYHKYWVDYSNLSEDDLNAKVENSKKEFIDVFIFLMNVAVFLGLDEKDIYSRYVEKQKINIERQENPDLGYINKNK